MAGGQLNFVNTGNAKLRYQLAAVSAVAAAILFYLAVRFETRDFLVAAPGEHNPDRHYSRVWFDAQDRMAALWRDGSAVTIESWPPDRSRTWKLDVPSGSEPAVAGDLSFAAWVRESSLIIQPLSGAAKSPLSIKLPPMPAPRAVSALPDDSVAVVFDDASVGRWNAATGDPIQTARLSLGKADRAAASRDYLAIASDSARRIDLYRFRDLREWTLVQDTVAPDPPYSILITAPGVMATLTSGFLKMDGKIRDAPGSIQSAVSLSNNTIVAGDFDGVFVLPENSEIYRVADAAPGAIVAASPSALAVSDRNGVRVLKLAHEQRLTVRGRMYSMLTVPLLLLAVILAGLSFLKEAFVLVFKTDTARTPILAKLDQPPGDLIRFCASGEAVLWAGAGLSAQSGFPLRAAFAATLVQSASIDSWVDPARVQKLSGMLSRGKAENAINELVASSGPVRNQLVAQYRSIFTRFAVLSKAHHAIARIPFATVLTTNYDPLLQQVEAPWAVTVLSPGAAGFPQAIDLNSLVKLYGELTSAQTLFLSRAEFEAAIARSPCIETIRKLFEVRSLLFAGCSLEGLVADLKALGLPEKPSRKHFAVVSASGSSWNGQAAELTRRYGIQVLACSEETINVELPQFLERLANGVEQAEFDSPDVTVNAPAKP
jgi:hypothetical protein